MQNILFGAGELFVFDEQNSNYKSLGKLNKATLEINKEIKQRVGDNKILPPREIIKEIIFSANLYEINIENIALLSPNCNKIEGENKQELIYSNLRNIFKFNKFKFENIGNDGRKFGFEIFSGYNKASIKTEFKEDSSKDEVVNIPIEIVAYKDNNENLIKIFDEVHK
ncbi:MAG: hypothetical protein N4A38_00590 [Candidatus Gracilibacteria bacterium]|nr:hypothetical protein [Candidatus Gracilibacteria bacterium]